MPWLCMHRHKFSDTVVRLVPLPSDCSQQSNSDPTQDPNAVPEPIPMYPETLTCYQSVSDHWREYTGYVRPVTLKPMQPQDGEVTAEGRYNKRIDVGFFCMKYLKKCSLNRPNARQCSQAEKAAGVERWEYAYAEGTRCAMFLAQSRWDEGIHNVTCCATSNCNKPDAAVDNTTRVIPEAKASSAPSNVSCYIDIIPRYGSAVPAAVFPMVFQSHQTGGWLSEADWGRFIEYEAGTCARFKYMHVLAYAMRYIRVYKRVLFGEL